jgi:hypothetical protein
MDMSAVEEAVVATLKKYVGGEVTVRVLSNKLVFRVDHGPRIPAVGGFVGGDTVGILRKGSCFPEMVTGVDPLKSVWFDLLLPLGWFD